MADGATSGEARYGAFISYSHVDTTFARRLHRRLETYRLPRRLARRTADGSAPSRRLKPIFRDRDELAAASDLTEAVREAIALSSYMIVVCSPAAATSEWVDLEIRLFRGLHGDHGILAALVRGEPAEAIPPAMTEGGDGPGPGHAHQPLAADFRPHADGEHLALLKLVAVLAGVGLDQLVQRDAQRRVRRMGAIGAASLFGMATAGVLAFAAIEGRIAAEHERARSQHVVDYMLTDLRGQLKGVGRLDALAAVNKGAMGYYKGENLSRLPPGQLIERAKLLQAVGEDDEKKGDYIGAKTQFDEASKITTALYTARPNDAAVIYAQAQSAYWDGFIRWRTGDDAGALAGFKLYAALAKRLPPIPNHDPDYQLEPANAESNLGLFVLRQSIDVRHARIHFDNAQRIFEAAGRDRPGDHDVQFAIADGHAWLADTDRLGGDFDGALAERMRQRATLQRLLASDPRDYHARSALVGNRLAVARISASRGLLKEAINQLRSAHGEAAALAAMDPENKAIAKEARVIELFEAQVWLAMPARGRPPPATIQKAVGDCAEEAAKPRNAELAAFCEIVDARRTGEFTPEDASTRVTSAIARLRGDGDYKLTERWMMNLSDNNSF
jgi:tetratricopeptide (TPR) repeat protein